MSRQVSLDEKAIHQATGNPSLRILGYPPATVLAEKLTTAINLGAANTRVRDYADIWTITGRHDLDAGEMVAMLRASRLR